MNNEEALHVCRIIKGAFPATTIDEFTPEAWALALEDERLEDALLALKCLMSEQPFAHVSDVIQRIKRIRGDRIRDFGPLPDPPAELADDPAAHQRWLRRTIRDIGDGTLTERPALPAGTEKPRELDFTSVFRSVDDVDGAA